MNCCPEMYIDKRGEREEVARSPDDVCEAHSCVVAHVTTIARVRRMGTQRDGSRCRLTVKLLRGEGVDGLGKLGGGSFLH